MASIMPITSARLMSVIGRPPHRLTSSRRSSRPTSWPVRFPGQVLGSEFLDHMADGDRLALRLGGLQGAGALTRMNASGKVFQCHTGLLAGRRQAQ